ncbi:MAG TPA: PadR family transcriptional regulator [Anaerolineae bacterium]|nr:PadR family transcriptional regulator [Anaerolineae bacterium]
MTQNQNIDSLLEKWETVYKRGLLSFWIMLLLNEREMYAYEMAGAIKTLSKGTIVADDNSIYRALKRFGQENLIASEKRISESGPARRYFWLTNDGLQLLYRFTQRNIMLFQQPQVMKAIEHILINGDNNTPQLSNNLGDTHGN